MTKELSNPECLKCGLLKSTIDGTAKTCCKDGIHDFGYAVEATKSTEVEAIGSNRKFYQMGYDEAQKDHIESLKRVRESVVDMDTIETTGRSTPAYNCGYNSANAIIRKLIDKELQ